MTIGILFELFSSWQFIFACIAVMLLLPLVFYLASRKPPKKFSFPKIPKARKSPKPRPERAEGEESEQRGDRDGRRTRDEEEGQDETEYRDEK